MNPETGGDGFYFPRGQRTLSIIFTAGMWITGKIGDEYRSAVNCYGSEYQPGVILPSGLPDDRTLDKYQMFKYNKGDVIDQEAIDQGCSDEVLGDQMLYCVYNDYMSHGDMWGSPHIGLEVQQTVFGFNRTGALGNTVFWKLRVINKGVDNLDSAYVGVFYDPDLGNANDDFTGCDTTLGIAYVYNGDGYDEKYGVEVPALASDFFQGPIVDAPGETTILPDGTVYTDKKMLDMTAYFVYFNGSPIAGAEDPHTPLGGWYFMSGRLGNGDQWIDPTAGNIPTTFPLAGDPVTGKGWLMGDISAPKDVRMGNSSGPFTLAVGDTQEIVLGVVVGQGTDNLSSVTVMRFYDKAAQIAYDMNFDLPSPPPQPVVNVAQMDEVLMLTWDKTAADFSEAGYDFEGYNVFQGQSEAGPWTRIGTFDKINGLTTIWDQQFSQAIGALIEMPVQYGVDAGLTFNFHVEKDYLLNVPLVNGRPYYFAVTGYAYNPSGVPKVLENACVAVEAVPQRPVLDVEHNADIEDDIEVTHTATGKLSDGSASVTVINPDEITGHDYEITIKVITAGPDSGKFAWNLNDVTTSQVVLADQLNQSGDDVYLNADGFLVRVEGPTAIGINLSLVGPYNDGYYGYSMGCDWTGTRWFSWSTNWGLEPFGGTVGNGYSFFGSTPSPDQYVDIELRFKFDEAEWQNAYGYRRDKGYAFEGMGKFPGQLWDVTNNKQLNICFVEDTNLTPADNLWNMGWVADSSKFIGEHGAREYLFLMASEYAESGAYDDDNDGTCADVMYAIGWTPRGTHPFLEDETIFYIYASFINTPRDKFSFSTADYNTNNKPDLAKERLDDINVFPNPYFAHNSAEGYFYTQFVTFNNLPEDNCIIRVFSLSGQLVTTLEHNNGTPFERWYLQNDEEIGVASGMYIIHIETDFGSKILKLGVINRQSTYQHL